MEALTVKSDLVDQDTVFYLNGHCRCYSIGNPKVPARNLTASTQFVFIVTSRASFLVCIGTCAVSRFSCLVMVKRSSRRRKELLEDPMELRSPFEVCRLA